MDGRTQGALLLAVAGIGLRLGLTDAAFAYVKPGMQPLLVATGVVLGVLGICTLVQALRGEDLADPEGGDHAALHGYAALEAPEDESGDAHVQAHGPAVAWLLVLPLLALLLVAPPALGSFAAERQSDRPPVSTQTSYPPLPEAERGAVPLVVSEYVFRALYDEERSLEGVRVRLVGFVTPAPGDGYHLTRFVLSCCAADATAVSVEVVGDRERAADTWLEVEGTWEPRPDEGSGGAPRPPLLRADSARTIEPPTQPYEY